MPVNSYKVQFKFGNKTAFDRIGEKNTNTLYFLEDVRQIYLGDRLISGVSVLCNTTDYWNQNRALVSEKGMIYVYSDYRVYNNQTIPGFKVGDGNAYVVDLPFVDKEIIDHIANTAIHVSTGDRTNWNEKVSCFISITDPENLKFIK